MGLLTWHLRPAGWLPPEGQGGDLQQDVYGVSHTPCESCMLFFPRRGGPHCLTQKRRAYRTCTAPVARVGLAEPLTPLFSSARTGLPAAGLYQQHDGYPQQGYQQGKGRASPSREARYRSRATRRARARARARGGRGSRATCIKGRARATGIRGSRSPRVLLKGHSVHSLDLTGGQRPRGASPLAATHSASLNHIHLASLWNRLGKQSLFHVASYMSLCFMHVRGLSH